MLKTASGRGFQPSFVMFDSWYSGTDNLRCISRPCWNWLTCIRNNRMVNPDDTDNRLVSFFTIPDDGLKIHMKKLGFVRVFHTINKDGKERYCATNFLTMDHQDRQNLRAICWLIKKKL